MKEQWFQNLHFLVRNYRKLPRNFLDFFVFATHCWWVLVHISSSILVCILGELAGGGFEVVAVGVSDMWHATRDTLHLTPFFFLFLFIYQKNCTGANICTCRPILSISHHVCVEIKIKISPTSEINCVASHWPTPVTWSLPLPPYPTPALIHYFFSLFFWPNFT